MTAAPPHSLTVEVPSQMTSSRTGETPRDDGEDGDQENCSASASSSDSDDADEIRCACCHSYQSDAFNMEIETSNASKYQTNLVVDCGHQFCDNCIERELSRRRTFPCPSCHPNLVLVKRVTLSSRSLDDFLAERDASWRRRVTAVYNKASEDFADKKEHDDYLEMVEDIIYSIVNELRDAEERKDQLRAHEESNRHDIVVRASRRADAERTMGDRVTAEIRDGERRKREFMEEERLVKETKRRVKVENTEVMLGEREELSAELRAAQMQGYRNSVRAARRGRNAAAFAEGPKVREPADGLVREKKPIDRAVYRRRVTAGGGIVKGQGDVAYNEQCWAVTVSSLFS
mmetsp:Transcript_41392/g.81104  ORF Transcript_41392/g.81104 Transcript_41392/m.81104 type:complete len:346 (-) Transcript_41392:325-1362(-)